MNQMLSRKENHKVGREYTRFLFTAGDRVYGEFEFPGNVEERISLKILDISAGGLKCTLLRDNDLNVCVGSTVIIHNVQGYKALEFIPRIKMEVRWMLDSPVFKNILVGCQFTDISESTKQEIEQFVGIREKGQEIVFCEECGSKNIVDSKVLADIDEQSFFCHICNNLISSETIISYSTNFNTLDKLTSGHLLLIDDDLGHLRAMAAILQKKYNVTMAPTGKHGLGLAEESNPDLILLDVNMPDMDGYEVCTKLKSNSKTRSIPVIFVTADTSDEGKNKGMSLGAVDYITKPLDQQLLDARIAVQLKFKRMQDEHKKQIIKMDNVISSFKKKHLEVDIELEKIRQDKKNIETILSSIDEIIFIQDNDQQIVWASKSALSIFGTILSDVIGKPCHLVLHNSDFVCSGCPVSTGGINSYSNPIEVYNNRLNKVLSQSHLPLFNDEGELTGTAHKVKVKKNDKPEVTNDSGQEEAVTLVNEPLSGKYNYSELNDIISAILLGSDTITQKYKTDAGLEEVNGYIGEAVTRLRSMLNDLPPDLKNK